MHVFFSHCRLALLALMVCLVSAAPAVRADAVQFTGKVVRDYAFSGQPAMRMPTSVVVTSHGTLFVADGVNARVLQFAPDGTMQTEIRDVGGEMLSRPESVALDGKAQLWVADSGHGRVLIRGVDGSLVRTITYAKPEGGHDPNPTDVAPFDEGKRAWIVDNVNHRLVLWEEANPTTFTTAGKYGAALGQFSYPFMIATDGSGRVFISDSLNGRVQAMDSSGKFTGIIGRYGVQPGELYRPKGVACDGDGRVWVADGVMGVVQVFEPAGRFAGVLREPSGSPMKFQASTGLAFGPDGDLYVVEFQVDRVRRVHIESKPGQQPLPGPGHERVVGGAGQSPTCTICHIEWLPTFAKGETSELCTLPPAKPNDPVVSQSFMCLSCHDGSIADSRRRVWLEHGHQTGQTPPPGMTVPDYLPLVDGKVACRTCHTAHAGGQQVLSLADIFFVRVENGSGQLCLSCHKDKGLGPAAGAHPVGGMPWAVPEKLVEAGAKLGPNPRELTCMVCHQPHGSQRTDLLVMGTESSQLCLTCHVKLRPGLWRPSEHEHPQNPPLQNAEQKQAIQAMGTRVGDNDTLICLSCHKVHHGVSQRYLLADTLQNSHLCLQCHPERKAMFGTPHDLRASAPQCRNRIGQTPEQSGPCGACHTFHRFARMPDPTAKDPAGLCMTCHQKDQCADKVDLAAVGHPWEAEPSQLPEKLELRTFVPPQSDKKIIACLTCHNPHKAVNRYFLATPANQLCGQCHAQPAASLAGVHDLSGRTDVVNGKGHAVADTGRCGFCHTMHEAKGPELWATTLPADATAEALCSGCHSAGGVAAKSPVPQFNHPTGPKTSEAAAKLATDLPLYHPQGSARDAAYVACSSCHNPHGNSTQSPQLLRGGPQASQLCVHCHKDVGGMAGGLHDVKVEPTEWPQASQKQSDECLSCHQPHSNDEVRGLWTVKPDQRYAVSDGACLGCHKVMQWGGHGTKPSQPPGPAPATQPVVTAGEVHGLPLVPTGPGKTSGAIGCKTCHNPHAPPGGPPHLLRAGKSLDPGAMCMACHTELQYIGLSLHSREQMKEFAQENPGAVSGQMLSCGPCHTVHASEGTTRPAAGPLKHLPVDVQRCVGCHSTSGGATPVKVVDHFGPLQNVTESGSAGFMPLVNDKGVIAAAGRIACITCHAPHGRPPGPGFPAVDPAKITEDQLKAMMPMVKAYQPPNLCSSCHGYDGMIRFLYYHDPDKRKELLQ